MSTSLLRGLRILELLGDEPRGVSELARALQVDKAGVSRTLASLHSENWVLRTGARYVLGERALGISSRDSEDVRRRAAVLAEELHERTGLTGGVVRLSSTSSTSAQPLALRAAEPHAWMEPDEPYAHLWSTAGGLALLAQLPEERVTALLEAVDWPDADIVRDRVRAVRAGDVAEERGWTIPDLGCIAMPWPLTEPAPPHAAVILGPLAAMDVAPLTIRDVLREAVARA